jgi:putative ABC transport system permease protein
MKKDLAFAVRMLLKNPAFTCIAILALGLGIGANTAIFSVVNAVLLKPLPYRDPDRLVRVYETFPEQGWRQNSVTAGNYLDWLAENQSFQDMAAMGGGDFSLTGDGEPVRLRGSRVSSSFFSVLKVQPALGRGFLAEEDRYGNHNSVVLSYGLWQRRFGGDLQILGKSLILNQNTHSVVGVMPAGFDFPDAGTEVWVPLAFRENEINNRRGHSYRVIARLKPGMTLPQAERDLNIIETRIGAEHRFVKGWGVELIPLKERLVGKSRPALLILLGAVGFVLLIACANVANLLLARAAARQKEFAIRAALGAGRFRVVRQLLTESVLLAVIGGIFGLLLAYWGVHALVALSPANLPRVEEIRIDRWVLFFTLGVSLATGAIFGLAPALQASKPDVNEALKDSGRGSTGGLGRNRLRSLLVVSEVALSLVLLISAGLMIRSFSRLREVNPGFNPDRILTMSISLPGKKYSELEKSVQFIDQLIQRVGNLPGIKSVGMINNLPLAGSGSSIAVKVEGLPEPAPGEPIAAGHRQISPNYFKTLGTAFVKGRDFNEHDRTNSIPVAIINDSFVRKFMRGQEPIGQRLNVGDGGPGPVEIVGVVKDIRHNGLDTEAGAEMYFPYMQRCWGFLTLVVRTASNPSLMTSVVRKEVQLIDKDQPVHNVRTMDQLVTESVAQRRLSMMLLGIFASVALVLAAVGIYGVMSYSVSQRTHEMGIRMALGARRGDVLRLVVKQGMMLAVIGVAVGLAGALALTHLMSTLLFEIKPTDLPTYSGVSLLLTAVAVSACFLPARRATRVDPIIALRYE